MNESENLGMIQLKPNRSLVKQINPHNNVDVLST